MLLSHLSDAENSERGAPQLSKGPSVCLNSIHVGIPQSFVPEVLPSHTHLHFCVLPPQAASLLGDGVIAAAGASLGTDRSSRRGEQ